MRVFAIILFVIGIGLILHCVAYRFAHIELTEAQALKEKWHLYLEGFICVVLSAKIFEDLK